MAIATVRCAALVASASLLTSSSFAQASLTVTPGRSTTTIAGTGVSGFSGDGGSAALAALATPAAVAYDSAGNLFVADTNNHAVRKVTPAGTISTIAGVPGSEGYAGDGAAATSALLDTPTGVAVDANGNLYIADSHNAVIRKVSGGIITTVAGNGTVGYSGDNGTATSAQLALPSAVAVDASGNLYIADTNNNRIRKVSGGIISTLAGTGAQGFAGDAGPAASAILNRPTGVAVDASGNVYIADRENHTVRIVSASGSTISTLAGSGSAGSFAGAFSGDNAASAASGLAKPYGVSVDSAGNVYVADTNNQRIREISGGVIGTVAGTGDQGFAGNGGPATSAILNAPRMAAPDAAGNLAIADTLNNALRSGSLGVLPSFGIQPPGSVSTAQAITLANNGSTLTVPSPATVNAALVSGGSCGTYPLQLAAGASCTQNVGFAPQALTDTGGSVTFSGSGFVTQKILLVGSADSVSIVVTPVQIVYGTATTTLSATFTFAHTQTISPSGNATFSVDSGPPYAAACTASVPGAAICSAPVSTGALSVGAHTITASLGAYSGTGLLQVQQTPGAIPVCTLGAAVGTSGSATTGAGATFTVAIPASCTGAPGHTLSTIINWDADHSQVQEPVTSSPATHVYNASGNYRVVLTATDVSPGLTTQFIGSATGSIAVVLPPPVTVGASTSSSTTVAQQVTPTPPTPVTFVCTSVTGTLANGQVIPTALPSQYGISCTPFATTVSSTAPTQVDVTIQTTAATAMNLSAPRSGIWFAYSAFPAGLLLFGISLALPRNRKRYAGRLRIMAVLIIACCSLSSCGGSFTPPALQATPGGVYYLTVNEIIAGPTPTGFIQTSLIVPLTIKQ